MTIQEFSNISSLTAKLVASLDAYKEAKTEIARREALQNATSLVGALENPADAIYKLFASV